MCLDAFQKRWLDMYIYFIDHLIKDRPFLLFVFTRKMLSYHMVCW